MIEDRLIRHTAASDTVLVVHANWELHGNDDDCGCSFFCSKCGFNFDEDLIYNDDGTKKRELPNLCERCGSIMDNKGET